MLTICTWLWGDAYGSEDVRKLLEGVDRNLHQPARFVVVSDRPFDYWVPERFSWIGELAERRELVFTNIAESDLPLTQTRGCFARLRMFDPKWQERIGAENRIVSLDLDAVPVSMLDPLFNRAENFVILQGANAANPCPYNGSIFMVRAGAHSEVFSKFSLDALPSIPKYEFPDDQGWFWKMIPNAAAWKVGSPSGIYAYCKPGWPILTHEDLCSGRKSEIPGDLPNDARLALFFGWRKPSKFTHLPWVRQHWR